jgi:hypothetical protein
MFKDYISKTSIHSFIRSFLSFPFVFVYIYEMLLKYRSLRPIPKCIAYLNIINTWVAITSRVIIVKRNFLAWAHRCYQITAG